MDALHSFVEDRGWENVEPLAWYRQPASVFMSAISCLFIFSANMQTFHEYLTGELGVHEYVSYGLYVGMLDFFSFAKFHMVSFIETSSQWEIFEFTFHLQKFIQ